MNHEVWVLSLGAGVQSTTLALLAAEGEFRCDAAIFADTQAEPQPTYAHLWWLAEHVPFPLYVESAGCLLTNILHGRTLGGYRCASVPFFIKHASGEIGRTRRQCTREYKVDVVEQAIRRRLLGLSPGRAVPRTTIVHQYVGISRDEARRAVSVKERIEHRANWRVHFPLLDRGWTRADCMRWLAGRVPYPVPKSACVCCPYRSNTGWQWLRIHDPLGWQQAIEIDRQLRVPGTIVNRKMNAHMYVHRDCVPLDEVDLGRRQLSLEFALECEGMCGV